MIYLIVLMIFLAIAAVAMLRVPIFTFASLCSLMTKLIKWSGSPKRRKTAKSLDKAVMAELPPLKLERARFEKGVIAQLVCHGSDQGWFGWVTHRAAA